MRGVCAQPKKTCDLHVFGKHIAERQGRIAHRAIGRQAKRIGESVGFCPTVTPIAYVRTHIYPNLKLYFCNDSAGALPGPRQGHDALGTYILFIST